MQDLSLGSDTEKGDLCAACETDGEYRLAVRFCLYCTSQYASPVWIPIAE